MRPGPGRRVQEVRGYSTVTPKLLEMADWLRTRQVTLVAMEATCAYCKPVFYLLEAEGFTCWLLNARHVKNVPGRPKTDKLDAVWLAKVVERGMCRPSLVQPKDIRQLWDVTRYRRSLIRDQTRAKQRLEKLLEDAQIKLTSVISNLHGVSGRQMLGSPESGTRKSWRRWRTGPCAARSRSCRRPSPASSTTITPICAPGCCVGSTICPPTSPRWTPGSRS
jgi:hypothetical protein